MAPYKNTPRNRQVTAEDSERIRRKHSDTESKRQRGSMTKRNKKISMTNNGKRKLNHIWDRAVLYYLAREAALRNGFLQVPDKRDLGLTSQSLKENHIKDLSKHGRSLTQLHKYVARGHLAGKVEAFELVRNCLKYGIDMGIVTREKAGSPYRVNSIAAMYMDDLCRYNARPQNKKDLNTEKDETSNKGFNDNI